jgi:hypothetical protein
MWVDGKGQDSRPRYIVLTEEGVEFFKELSKGRGRGELLFLRPGVNRKGGRDRHVILNNTRIRLSPGEDALLRILVERAGGLVLYSELASRLPNVMPDPRKATVRAMNTVEQVRHKLQHQGRPQFLRGGGGVRFALPDSDSLEFEEASEAVPEAPATVLGGWLKDDAQGPIRKAYTAAGLEPLTFHELRHTYTAGYPHEIATDQKSRWKPHRCLKQICCPNCATGLNHRSLVSTIDYCPIGMDNGHGWISWQLATLFSLSKAPWRRAWVWAYN